MNAIDYINSFTKSGKPVTDLSRINALLNSLDNPHNKLNFVHIAGTNGKGSVLEFASQACIHAGYKTGQFTSPFVTRYEDRIRINGNNIDGESLEKYCSIVKQAVDNNEYSQFEISFAIALLYFLSQKCDIIFLETGIGGSLDATNIIQAPLASVITSVSYDHTDLLGDTLYKIAGHKAGIIKPDCYAILSPDNPKEVVNTIKATAEKQNAKLIVVDKNNLSILNHSQSGSDFTYKGTSYHIRMLGIHQIYNACTAIETINLLSDKGFTVNSSDIHYALNTAQIGSRIELISSEPVVLLDGAHNLSGISALANVVKDFNKKPVISVVGMLNNKDYVSSMKIISEFSDAIVCVDGFSPNNVRSGELSCLCKNIKNYAMNFTAGIKFSIKLAKQKNGLVAVCGSLYLASAVKNFFDDKFIQN